MGLLDRFRKRTAVTGSFPFEVGDYPGAWRLSNEEYLRILGLSPSEMWRTQPYLRIAVNFMARNIAQLGLHTFERVSDTDRRRIREGGIAEVLASPNRSTTPYELIHGLVADLALYDSAYWLISDDPTARLVRLPVPWVTPRGGDLLGAQEYEVRRNDRGESVVVPADQILAFHGWSPESLVTGSSPINALKEILAEQVQAARYREQVWRRGGKVGAVLSRPKDAPPWSDDARKQFKVDWESQFTGDGPRVGGTPLLEDGMTLNRVDFSAHEMEFIDGARLALNTVASVYHIPPPMVGLLENANFSNVREFRKMLYGDTLGPVLAQLEDRINTFLVPRLDDRAGVYVEFNIEEKLQGNFEDQASALQSSVGAPWLTRNEARALRNLPSIDGGDELVTPLNVLIGGQASPSDTGSQNATGSDKAIERGAAQLKAFADISRKAQTTETQREQIQRVLTRFFDRQGKSVLSALGGDGEWWDGERWDRELAEDLSKVGHTIAAILGANEAERLGYSDAFDPDMTVNFLKSVAESRAAGINATTKAALDKALDDDADPATVFETAKNDRAQKASVSMSTFLAGFAAVESAKQIGASEGVRAVKTWNTGANPRATHAEMDGETVPVDEPFSNGMDWPGQGDPEDAGCNCGVTIDFEEASE